MAHANQPYVFAKSKDSNVTSQVKVSLTFLLSCYPMKYLIKAEKYK